MKQNEKKKNIVIKISTFFGRRQFHVSFFLFFLLSFFSVAVFVNADETRSSDKNFFEDTDQDGLTNDEERLYGTDPQKKDTDGDGYGDGVEIESGYHPLIKAPGDKISFLPAVGKEGRSGQGGLGVDEDGNLTEMASQHIAGLLSAASENKEMSMNEINEAVDTLLREQTEEEIILPEVKREDIKIKESPSSSLPDDEREKRIKQDIVEYITILGYLLMNNSPIELRENEDFTEMMTSVADNSAQALATGDLSYIEELSGKGEKMLEEIKAIEVPEEMVDLHIQALELALYAQGLEEELAPNEQDPLGQIAVLSKLEGLIRAGEELSVSFSATLDKYGLADMALGL